MSLLVGHITASGFSRNTEPARLLRAVVWLLQNMALGVTQKPEPLHLSMYLEKFSASRARSVERLVQWSSYHIAFSYLKRERKKKKAIWSILALGCCGFYVQLPGESLWPVLRSSSFGNDQCTSENANVRIVTLLNRLKSRKAYSLTTPETLERARVKSPKNLHFAFWLILKFSSKELICDAPAWICWRKALDFSRHLSNKSLELPQRGCCLTNLLHFHRRLFLYKCTDLN